MVFEIPDEEIIKAQLNYIDDYSSLSLGVYELDLSKLIQKNLFSGFEREIKQKTIDVKENEY